MNTEPTQEGIAPRSCKECSHYVDESMVGSRFDGIHIGAPVCQKRLHVLGIPRRGEKVNQILLEQLAEDCSNYTHENVEEGSLPAFASFSAYVPRENWPFDIPESSVGQRPHACSACAFYVDDSTVYAETGYSSGICSATGVFTGSNPHGSKLHNVCNFGTRAMYGEPATMEGMTLLETFERAINAGSNLAASLSAYVNPMGAIDPTEYPSDLPVSSDDEAIGIRAWRLVKNPHGEKYDDITLPIFRSDAYDDEQRERIPSTGGAGSPEFYVDHSNAIFNVGFWSFGKGENSNTCALIGPAGTGKTEVGRVLAWLNQQPLRHIEFTSESENIDVFGDWVVHNGTMEFAVGPLTESWTKNEVISLDEINVAQPAIKEAMRSGFSSGKTFSLDRMKRRDEKTGKFTTPPRFEAAPYQWCIVSMNPPGAIYANTQPLSAADISRFAHVAIGYAPVEIERDILIRRYMMETGGKTPSETMMEKVMTIAQELRSMVDNDALPYPWGMREQFKVMTASRYVPMVKAYEMALGNHLDANERMAITTCVESHIPSERV